MDNNSNSNSCVLEGISINYPTPRTQTELQLKFSKHHSSLPNYHNTNLPDIFSTSKEDTQHSYSTQEDSPVLFIIFDLTNFHQQLFMNNFSWTTPFFPIFTSYHNKRNHISSFWIFDHNHNCTNLSRITPQHKKKGQIYKYTLSRLQYQNDFQDETEKCTQVNVSLY